MSIINSKQKKELINAYYYRMQAFGIDLNKKDLEKKLLFLDEKELRDIFLDIMKGNEKDITTLLNRLNIPAANKNETINDLQEQVKKSLNLSSITEFNNKKKSYFKFKAEDGSIYLVRNLDNDSKQLFLEILNNKNVANTPDGKKNTAEIFKFLQSKQFIEIPLENSMNIDSSKHPKTQVTILKEIEKQFPTKQVIASVTENLYIVKGNSDEEDIILSITKENNKYKVSPLIQKTYGSKPEEMRKENVQNQTEMPNDIIIELENNEEIGKVIEDGLNMNLSDEMINENVIETINTKYPKFKTIPSLSIIIMSLIKKIKEKRNKSSQSNSLGGKQYILTTNKTNHYLDSEVA